jgi:hypothetical protein
VGLEDFDRQLLPAFAYVSVVLFIGMLVELCAVK